MDGSIAGQTAWVEVCRLEEIPRQGSRVVATAARGEVALFRALDDAVFALEDRCPHKGGPLSQGIVHGHAVTCPLHNWVIDLASGEAVAPDKGCAPRIPVRVEAGRVLLALGGRG
ncbi:nitrite reductase small subunit NirD [Siccirubricoccus sp. KC 17139]|uniref:Nitrite reductase small subunit NirD n=1 Tax=Siccirubricoccus soli TaxID=2899147 RepID=A0ABT1D9C6_9PROT|nr:nitrite reductase small subunit NirD [Siccirubricoccus soli]MCO6418459.1 nitrite reductase small subunit NirD [Siccirubricoccus soli]MCP2684594.1 nitrite reductase small subunit NirD [Siccirubricoccus soli]